MIMMMVAQSSGSSSSSKHIKRTEWVARWKKGLISGQIKISHSDCKTSIIFADAFWRAWSSSSRQKKKIAPQPHKKTVYIFVSSSQLFGTLFVHYDDDDGGPFGGLPVRPTLIKQSSASDSTRETNGHGFVDMRIMKESHWNSKWCSDQRKVAWLIALIKDSTCTRNACPPPSNNGLSLREIYVIYQ